MPTGALPGLPTSGPKVEGPSFIAKTPAIETYVRIARGIMACWFGANGPLTPTHIFYADVPPEDKSPNIEIVIHQRDLQAENPRGVKALTIKIGRMGEAQSLVEVVNSKFDSALAPGIRRDVEVWTTGSTECGQLKPLPGPATSSPETKQQKRKSSKGKSVRT